jgi:Holliday junction DNA helicase RuvA
MIRSLGGTVTHHVATGIILDVRGVGYLVAVPLRTVPPIGSSVQLFTHHHVREQAQSLYGFEMLDELETFESLLEVPSIGPKSALAILSLASAEQIRAAVDREDTAFFASVPGIGKKSAASIIVALTGKLAPSLAGSSPRGQLTEALTALGYTSRDLDPVLRELPSELVTIEAQIRWVLAHLRRP